MKKAEIIDLDNIETYKDLRLHSSRILCIDPGFANTGWILFTLDDMQYITSGIIHTESSTAFEERLVQLYVEMNDLIDLVKPDIFIIESISFISYKTSKLMESRFMRAIGVLSIIGLTKVDYYIEITPARTKKSIRSMLDANAREIIKQNSKNRTQAWRKTVHTVTERMINDEFYSNLILKSANEHIVDAAAIGCCFHIIYTKNMRAYLQSK